MAIVSRMRGCQAKVQAVEFVVSFNLYYICGKPMFRLTFSYIAQVGPMTKRETVRGDTGQQWGDDVSRLKAVPRLEIKGWMFQRFTFFFSSVMRIAWNTKMWWSNISMYTRLCPKYSLFQSSKIRKKSSCITLSWVKIRHVYFIGDNIFFHDKNNYYTCRS